MIVTPGFTISSIVTTTQASEGFYNLIRLDTLTVNALNLFAYANNDPNNITDPFGLVCYSTYSGGIVTTAGGTTPAALTGFNAYILQAWREQDLGNPLTAKLTMGALGEIFTYEFLQSIGATNIQPQFGFSKMNFTMKGVVSTFTTAYVDFLYTLNGQQRAAEVNCGWQYMPGWENLSKNQKIVYPLLTQGKAYVWGQTLPFIQITPDAQLPPAPETPVDLFTIQVNPAPPPSPMGG